MSRSALRPYAAKTERTRRLGTEGRSARRRHGHRRGVLIDAVVIAAAIVAVGAVAAHAEDISASVVSWRSAALVVLIASLTLAPAVRLRGRHVMQDDVVESGLMLTAALVPDGEALVIVAAALAIKELLSPHCWHKQVFNASQTVVAGAAAFAIYGGGRPDSAGSVASLALAGLTAAVITNGMTWAIVQVTQGMQASEWRESVLGGLYTTTIAISVGVLAASMSDEPWLLALLGVPIIGVIFTGTARTRSDKLADQSRSLLDAAIDAGAAADVDTLRHTLLRHAEAISHGNARFTNAAEDHCLCLPMPPILGGSAWVGVELHAGDPWAPSVEPALRTLLAIVTGAAESLALRAQLVEQATTDELTGLRNRRSFDQHLVDADARARSDEGGRGGFTLLFIDLDRFKAINDTLGHDVGDDLLRAVAERLVEAVRPDDAVFRLAGDEFVVLLEGVKDVESATSLLKAVRQAMTRPFPMLGPLEMKASVGAAAWHVDIADPWDLVREADELMYADKARVRA